MLLDILIKRWVVHYGKSFGGGNQHEKAIKARLILPCVDILIYLQKRVFIRIVNEVYLSKTKRDRSLS